MNIFGEYRCTSLHKMIYYHSVTGKTTRWKIIKEKKLNIWQQWEKKTEISSYDVTS